MSGCTYLTEEQVVQVYEYFGKKKNALRNQAILLLGVTTGLRISDILNLKIRDVSFKDMTIKDIIKITTIKTGRSVELKIVPSLQKHLKKYLLHLWKNRFRHEGRFLFPSPRERKKQLSDVTVRGIFYRFAQDLKISGQICTHSMRKTFARQVYQKMCFLNVDPWPVLMLLLDHQSISSTQRYLSFIFLRDDPKYLTSFDKILKLINEITLND